MKFTAIKSDLLNAINAVANATAKKNTAIPTLEGIKITVKDKKVTLCGYDLEMAVLSVINEVAIAEEGEIVLAAKTFGNIISKAANEKITIQTDEKGITHIQSGKSKNKIVGLNPAEYPDLPNFEENESLEIDGEELKKVVKETVYACSTDTQKPIFTGSLFEVADKTLTVVAIDGYRMAVRKTPIETDLKTSFVVPAKAQNEIVKSISKEKVKISVGQRHIGFKFGNTTVITRLIEGNFIDYKSTCPKNCNFVIEINRKSFMEAIDRMSVVSEDKITHPTKLEIKDKTLKLAAMSAIGFTEEEIEGAVVTLNPENKDNTLLMGFNNKYLMDAIKNLDCENITIRIASAVTPLTVHRNGEEEKGLNLVVPMRLASN